ncbi:multi-sensor hybrid histidine kinase [Candidatus Koribacter versatilis Ellin345]|uniref:histidine kinase n=2 Tax=Candidatus Korobacter versatilis TaxID=658062 RepID=Q1ILL3_KORVE|nr:multi-sensor hybrid histidine kinase [Candidatus Koribacter versatilis Ellin345]
MTLLYALAGLAWIFVTGMLNSVLVTSPRYQYLFELGKGALYVCLSALLIFFLLKRHEKQTAILHEAILHSQELYRIQSEVLELVASGADIRKSMKCLASGIEQLSREMLCSVLQVTEDQKHLRTLAAPSLPAEYSAAVENLPIGPEQGSCGTAAFRKETVVVSDIASDPLWTNYRDLARRHGLAACWSTPVISRDATVMGTFALYFRTPRSPDKAELELTEFANHTARVAMEHDRTRRLLARSEEDYRNLIENAPLGIYRSSRSAERLLFVNDAMVRLLGYDSKEEVLALRIRDELYVDPAARKRAYDSLKGNTVADLELEWKKKTGPPITMRAVTRQLVTEKGEQIVEVVCEDLSQRRALENRTEQANRLEALGRLAAGVAHDFNNVLMIVQAYSDLLKERFAGDASAEKHVTQIQGAVDRAAKLTAQLLAFGRGHARTEAATDINAVILESVENWRRVLGPQIQFELQLHPEALFCGLSRAEAEQILLNMMLNTRDAMPDGGKVTLKTDLVIADETAKRLRITISDTGVGIPKEVLPHIFDPFYTTKQKGKGSGLGLASVYGIVQQHDGEISVTSEPTHGTTFEILLNVVAGVGEGAASAQASQERLSTKVLVVDDEAGVREGVADWLRRRGDEVYTAASAEDAIVLLNNGVLVDVMVTDFLMPGMNGLELARAVKAKHPAIATIIMTGYADEDLSEGREFLHVHKPVELPALSSLIRKAREK